MQSNPLSSATLLLLIATIISSCISERVFITTGAPIEIFFAAGESRKEICYNGKIISDEPIIGMASKVYKYSLRYTVL